MQEKNKTKIKTAVRAVYSEALLRFVFIALILVLQLFLVVWIFYKFRQYSYILYVVSSLIGLALALHISNSKINPAYKIPWIILILLIPVFGIVVYLVLGSGYKGKRMKAAFKRHEEKLAEMLKPEVDLLSDLEKENPSAANQMKYLQQEVCPAYNGTIAEYLSPGEVMFKRLKEELEKAEKFIFMEYFTISSGQMWNEILDILIRKAAQGVEVRVMYDDFGSLLSLPYKYHEYLESVGIKNCVVNQILPILNAFINNRDHRKITVVDGKVAFTGGINIADEYINLKNKHGHWKDSAILIKGEAVWSFTVMFLSIWEHINENKDDYYKYKNTEPSPYKSAKGLIQPYHDSPLDTEQVGENVYLNMLSRAKKYVYIETPYLVIDREMQVALCNAAKQGVDVRIITPYYADHWYVHPITRSNYEELIINGVKIYEYTPGFIHSKIFICDDELAVLGTVNMDYRSLYLHFECGVLVYDAPVIEDMYKDFMEILKRSHKITLQDCQSVPLINRFARSVLNLFAPLM